ncbi:MAG: S49 family peptidase [Pseudoruegeria sp.]
MNDQTVASLIGPQVVALDEDLAQGHLAMSLPTDQSQASAEDNRFAIARGVAVVRVAGILTPNMKAFERWFGWATYFGLAEVMGTLSSEADVRAIVLEIDSPGGLVVGLEAAAQAVAAAAQIKPVHAIVNPLAASAAYWIASQASEISLTPGALVGSIGTAMQAAAPVGPGMSGVQLFDLASSHARAKRPDPTTETGRAELQRSLDESEAKFHAAVASGRGIDPIELKAILSVTGDPVDGGATFSGTDAITRRLVDRQETAQEFMARIVGEYAPTPERQRRRAHAVTAQAIQVRAAL